MSRNPEDFARGLGYKISQVPKNSNKFRNKCVDCGTNVFQGEGYMVKGDDHDKIKTVCRVCGNQWLDKGNLKSDIIMKNVEDLHKDWQGGGFKTWSGEKYDG